MAPTLPRSVQDYHQLLEWIIPLPDRFPRARKCRPFFLLGLLFGIQAFAQESANTLSAENNLSQSMQEAVAESNENPCQHQPGQSPEMVVIQGGDFLMGSPDTETDRDSDEGPQRRVWVQPFALGRCEVTVAEFRLFVSETGYKSEDCNVWDEESSNFVDRADASWRGPAYAQTERSPVTCASWQDAHAYVLWISLRTGVEYRLPTEAEWEYAARAGTATPFSTGDCISATQANFDFKIPYGECPVEEGYLQKTKEVGIYQANPFGLFDIHGNLLEWTQDCWHGSFQGAPESSGAWLQEGSGDCSNRVLRGGSWNDSAKGLRSAGRTRDYTGNRYEFIGFRLARTLPTEPIPQGQGVMNK